MQITTIPKYFTMSQSMPNFRVNNFDLLRLLAASQVVFFHGVEHLDLHFTGAVSRELYYLISLFPGVPVFFVISGFLISLSFERNSDIKTYAFNRALRIFPALWACLAFSLLTVTMMGYWDTVNVPLEHFVTWIGAQVSIGQVYNPGFLREYGVGTLNGSLWTIPVEIQFYFMLPVVYAILKWLKPKTKNSVILLLLIAFLMLNTFLLDYRSAYPEARLTKVMFATFVPYFFMFLTGVLIQRLLPILRPYLDEKGVYWLTLYIASAFIFDKVFGLRVGTNFPNYFSVFILALTTISCAFTTRGLSRKLLGENDISYGTYIYHMVVINMFVESGKIGSFGYMVLVFAITYMLGFISWQLIEKNALSLKRKSLRTIQDNKIIHSEISSLKQTN